MLRALRARSPAPAASAILFDQLDGRRILLVKRRYDPYRGYWSLPGGHVETGESSLEAALRETLEETGIEAEIVGLAGITEVIGSENHYLIIVYWGYGRGEPEPSDDADDARWVDAAAITSLKLTPSARHMLSEWRPGLQLHIVCRGGRCETLNRLECSPRA